MDGFQRIQSMDAEQIKEFQVGYLQLMNRTGLEFGIAKLSDGASLVFIAYANGATLPGGRN